MVYAPKGVESKTVHPTKVNTFPTQGLTVDGEIITGWSVSGVYMKLKKIGARALCFSM